jgi:hypothetical protein
LSDLLVSLPNLAPPFCVFIQLDSKNENLKTLDLVIVFPPLAALPSTSRKSYFWSQFLYVPILFICFLLFMELISPPSFFSIKIVTFFRVSIGHLSRPFVSWYIDFRSCQRYPQPLFPFFPFSFFLFCQPNQNNKYYAIVVVLVV